MATFSVNFKSKNLFDNLKQEFDEYGWGPHQNGDEYVMNFEFLEYDDLPTIVYVLNRSFHNIDFNDRHSFMENFFLNMWDNYSDLGISDDELGEWENDLKDYYHGR